MALHTVERSGWTKGKEHGYGQRGASSFRTSAGTTVRNVGPFGLRIYAYGSGVLAMTNEGRSQAYKGQSHLSKKGGGEPYGDNDQNG